MAKRSSRESKAAKPKQNARRGSEDLTTGSLAPSDLRARSVEEEIGTEVRRLRKGLDLTVAELGAAAGISAGMLSKIENGSISPSLSTIGALAKALKLIPCQ